VEPCECVDLLHVSSNFEVASVVYPSEYMTSAKLIAWFATPASDSENGAIYNSREFVSQGSASYWIWKAAVTISRALGSLGHITHWR
jgi:hypothetical protein